MKQKCVPSQLPLARRAAKKKPPGPDFGGVGETKEGLYIF